MLGGGSLKSAVRRYLGRNRPLILAYHSIRRSRPAFPLWHHLVASDFEAQIRYLARHFRCVRLADLLAEFDGGKFSPHSVALTFDDGFSNNLHVALPILDKFNVPATFFLTTGWIGSDSLLWTEEVALVLAQTKKSSLALHEGEFDCSGESARASTYRRIVRHCKPLADGERADFMARFRQQAQIDPDELRGSPAYDDHRSLTLEELDRLAAWPLAEFGAHTVSHPVLSRLGDSHAEQEMAQSRAAIEDRLGPIKYFAYPFGGEGDFGMRDARLARLIGFEAAFTSSASTLTPQLDRFHLPRFGVGWDCSLEDFCYAVDGGLAKRS